MLIIAILNDIHRSDAKFRVVYVEHRMKNSSWNNMSILILHILKIYFFVS